MNLRNENGIPLRCGDMLSEIEGFDGELHYTATACVSYPRGNDKIGHLTSAPTSPSGVKIRKFNGDVVWWCEPPSDPTSLMAAMRDIMALLCGEAMQITVEVRCIGGGRRTHYWESHVIHDRDAIGPILLTAKAAAVRERKAK